MLCEIAELELEERLIQLIIFCPLEPLLLSVIEIFLPIPPEDKKTKKIERNVGKFI